MRFIFKPESSELSAWARHVVNCKVPFNRALVRWVFRSWSVKIFHMGNEVGSSPTKIRRIFMKESDNGTVIMDNLLQRLGAFPTIESINREANCCDVRV